VITPPPSAFFRYYSCSTCNSKRQVGPCLGYFSGAFFFPIWSDKIDLVGLLFPALLRIFHLVLFPVLIQECPAKNLTPPPRFFLSPLSTREFPFFFFTVDLILWVGRFFSPRLEPLHPHFGVFAYLFNALWLLFELVDAGFH